MATAVRAFEALADPTRRAVVEALRDGPRSVGEIAEGLPVSRPAVSQHLKVLVEADLVDVRQVGTRRHYFVRPGGADGMRAWLDEMWDVALSRFALLADNTPDPSAGGPSTPTEEPS